MTNYEHYRNDIEKFVRLGLAFAFDNETEKVVLCQDFECDECKFCSEIDAMSPHARDFSRELGDIYCPSPKYMV